MKIIGFFIWNRQSNQFSKNLRDLQKVLLKWLSLRFSVMHLKCCPPQETEFLFAWKTNTTDRPVMLLGIYVPMICIESRGATRTFRKIFKNKSAFLRVWSRKKVNFKLAVLNSNRFFILVFLQNLFFQQLYNEMIWVNSLNMCANRKRVFFKYMV